MEVKQKNPLFIENLKLRYKQEPLEAAVGYPRGKDNVGLAHYPNRDRRKKKDNPLNPPLGGGPSIIEVAIWNNYGTETSPRRAFMELAAKMMQPEYKRMLREAVKRINSGELSLKTLLKAVAQMGEAKLRQAIMEGDWAPNSPETIARKGSDRPLMDTGDLRKYATSDVRSKTQ